MKTLTGLALFLSLNVAHASFNRFWIGYKLETVKTSDFLNGLNQRLLPDLIKLAAGKGLVSYSPYVSNMNASDLPDEIALITYESEEVYKKVRSTPAGTAYSDLHWELFRKDISKSTVPVQFTGELTEGNAYELNAKFEDWKSGSTVLTIYKRSGLDLKKLGIEFSSLKQKTDLNNAILLVTPAYLYEYRSYKSSGVKLSPLNATVVSTTGFKKTVLGKPLGFNEGYNVQF